jgi:hypothetical protein
LEFHFERVGYPSTTAYKVAVIAAPDKTYNFTMQKNEGKWNIADGSNLPVWIISFEEELSDSICAHHKRNTVF